METILKIEQIEKYYGNRSSLTKALDTISFEVEKGEFIAIMGASGSGKTTLLNCISTIDTVTSGHIYVEGKDITTLHGSQLADFRGKKLGFIFQDFNLLDTFSLRDNILLPLVLSGKRYGEMEGRLTPVVKDLGIEDLLNKYPYEVSGGQKQRAAVARALITRPQVLFADEPTGALDSGSTEELLRLFGTVNGAGQTIVMVTHSVRAASCAGRVLFLRDGAVAQELTRGTDTETAFYRRIADALTASQTGGGAA